MRFGAMNFPARPLEEEIKSFAPLGFDYLELTLDPPLAQAAILRQKRETVLGLLQEKGLGLVCHLPTFVFIADLTRRIREASVQETLEALELAGDWGAQRVVLHPGFFYGMGIHAVEESRRCAMESLQNILARAEKLDLPVCLENMFPSSRWMVEAEEFLPLLAAFPKLSVALDIGHAHIEGGLERILSFIRICNTRIGHIHLSDNNGKADDHLPIGVGRIDFSTVLPALKRIPYDGDVTLEVFARDRDYLAISREKFSRLWSQSGDGL